MSLPDRLRVGYLLADPGVDLAKHEGCRAHVEHIVEGLRRAGHTVRFLGMQPDGILLADHGEGMERHPAARVPVPAVETRTLAEVYGFPPEGFEPSVRVATAGRAAFRDCDVIHARLSPFDLGGMLCAARLGLPLVVEANSPPVEEARQFYPELFTHRSEPLAILTAQRTFHAAAAIVAVSTALRDLLIGPPWNVDRNKISVVPNAADPLTDVPSADRRRELRRLHGLGDGPIVVFVGALQPWHGLDELLEAFARVHRRRTDVRLLLIGDGVHRPRVEQGVTSHGLQGAVVLAGGVPRASVAEFLALADVAVAPYPTLPLGFYFSPLKVFEYMAAGRAIVASRIGQLPEVLEHEVTALLVEPGNAVELSAAIERLLDDEALRTRIGAAARDKAERDHTWDGYISRLVEIYRAIATP